MYFYYYLIMRFRVLIDTRVLFHEDPPCAPKRCGAVDLLWADGIDDIIARYRVFSGSISYLLAQTLFRCSIFCFILQWNIQYLSNNVYLMYN